MFHIHISTAPLTKLRLTDEVEQIIRSVAELFEEFELGFGFDRALLECGVDGRLGYLDSRLHDFSYLRLRYRIATVDCNLHLYGVSRGEDHHHGSCRGLSSAHDEVLVPRDEEQLHSCHHVVREEQHCSCQHVRGRSIATLMSLLSTFVLTTYGTRSMSCQRILSTYAHINVYYERYLHPQSSSWNRRVHATKKSGKK